MVYHPEHSPLVARCQQIFETEYSHENVVGEGQRIWNLRTNEILASGLTYDEAQRQLKLLFALFVAGYVAAADDAGAVELLSRKIRGT